MAPAASMRMPAPMPMTIPSGSIAGLSGLYRRFADADHPVRVALIVRRKGYASVAQLGGGGDDVDECAVAERGHLGPATDRLVEHQPLQGLRVVERLAVDGQEQVTGVQTGGVG